MTAAMWYMEKHRKGIYDIFTGNELPRRSIGVFYAHLLKIEKCNGTKELVAELKRRSHALLTRTGPYKTHRDGTWFGAWRPLSRLARNRGRDGLCCALRILKLYGLFVAKEPKLEDYLDVAIAISETPEKSDYFSYQNIGKEKHVCKDLPDIEFDPYYPLGTTKVPITREVSLSEIFVTPQQHIEALDNCPRIMVRHYEAYKELVGRTLPPVEYYQNLVDSGCGPDVVGSIRILTKDRGLKMRAVVNPFRIHQLATSRLKNALYSFLKTLDESHVFDQDMGAAWVIGRLGSNVKLSSIDLKSASDNIPLGPQLQLARELFPGLAKDIEIFGDLNRCFWWSPYPESDAKYTRGHGMGLNGSFPLFTTWLALACYFSNARGCFAIVGDDLVIESKYQDSICSILEKYGVPINHAKSIFNDSIAEFVGRLLDRWGSLKVYKASPLNLQRDPLGYIRQYGVKAFNRTSLKRAGKSFRKRLLLFLEVGTDLQARILLSTFLEKPKDAELVSGRKPPRMFRGGCPTHLAFELAKTLEPETTAERALEMVSKATYEANPREQGCYRFLEVLMPADKALKFNVKGWEFQVNPGFLVTAFNLRVRKNLEKDPFFYAKEGLAESEALSKFWGLKIELPDLDRVIEEAKDRRLLSRRKREEKAQLDGKYPMSYIAKFTRAWNRGLKVLRTLIRSA